MPQAFWSSLWCSLKKLPVLQYLTVEASDIVGLQDDDGAFSGNLKALTLKHCRLSDIPQALMNMTCLSSLCLHGNMLKEVPPGPYLEQLTHLDIGANKLGPIPSALANCCSLQRLVCNWPVDDENCWDAKTLKRMLLYGCELKRSVALHSDCCSCGLEIPFGDAAVQHGDERMDYFESTHLPFACL